MPPAVSPRSRSFRARAKRSSDSAMGATIPPTAASVQSWARDPGGPTSSFTRDLGPRWCLTSRKRSRGVACDDANASEAHHRGSVGKHKPPMGGVPVAHGAEHCPDTRSATWPCAHACGAGCDGGVTPGIGNGSGSGNVPGAGIPGMVGRPPGMPGIVGSTRPRPGPSRSRTARRTRPARCPAPAPRGTGCSRARPGTGAATAVRHADLVRGAQVLLHRDALDPRVAAVAPLRAPGVVDEELLARRRGAIARQDDRVAGVLLLRVVGDHRAGHMVFRVPRIRVDPERDPDRVAAREHRAHLLQVRRLRLQLLDRGHRVAPEAVGLLPLGAQARVEVARARRHAVRLAARVERLPQHAAGLRRIVRPALLEGDALALRLIARRAHPRDRVLRPDVERGRDVAAPHLPDRVVHRRRERHRSARADGALVLHRPLEPGQPVVDDRRERP